MKRAACVLALIVSALGSSLAGEAKAALPFSQTGPLSDLLFSQYGPSLYDVAAQFPVFGFGGYADLTDPSRTVGNYANASETILFSLHTDAKIINVSRFYVVDEYWSDHLVYFVSGTVGGAGGSDFEEPAPGPPAAFDFSDGSIQSTITARETSDVSGYIPPVPADYDLFQESYRPLGVYVEFQVIADPGATFSVSATLVPEPQTWGLMIMGLIGVGVALRSRAPVKPIRIKVTQP